MARWVMLYIFALGWLGPAAPQEDEGPAPAASVAATLELVGGTLPTASPPPRVVATWYGKAPASVIEVQAETGTPLNLPLKPGRWVLEGRAPGFWGEPVQVELGEGEVGRAVRLKLWPAATLEGGVMLPDGEHAPEDFALFFRPSPEVAGGKGVPRGRVVCPILEKKWVCSVPAGLLDIQFYSSGFVPRYLWGVNAPAGKTVQVGRAMLARGSAVQGWVVTADGTPLAKDARVRLKPRGAGGVPRLTEVARSDSLAMTAPINDRGFFELADLSPGEYELEAVSGKFAPAVTTVRVVPGKVTEVANPPLTLDYPIALRAYLDPPLDPWGERWEVTVRLMDRATSVWSEVGRSRVQPDGSWTSEGLTQGLYFVTVVSSKGDPWWSEGLELAADSPPLQIELSVVRVRGEVRLGKRPLAAQLIFGGKHHAVRIETTADEEGEFSLLLPKSGDWRVHVATAEPPVERELRSVRVSPKPGTQEAEVVITLPDTLVRGSVVDERGAAVTDAIVSFQAAGEPLAQVRTGPRGKFEARGLAPGTARVEAEAFANLGSDVQLVEIVENVESPALALVLRERLKVAGFVGSSIGAVAGARIMATPVAVPYIGRGVNSSDSQGRFELSLPRATRELLLAVGAPGFAFRMLRAPVPTEGPLPVGVRQESGTLVIESSEPLPPTTPGPAPIVLHGGGVEYLTYLEDWAFRNGVANTDPRKVVIPLVEPGEYAVCWGTPAEKAALDLGALPATGCAKGHLPENGELTLALGERERP